MQRAQCCGHRKAKLDAYLDKTVRILLLDSLCRQRAFTQINDLESERDLSQYIVHADMDAFFAAVEVIYNLLALAVRMLTRIC